MTDYHSIKAINASGINKFIRSPLHYWRESPFNPGRIVNEPTPAMIFGKLVHCLVLTPESFEEEFALAPDINKRTNEGKAQWQQFQSENAGKTIITLEQWNQADALRNAVWMHPTVKGLLGNGQSEEPITWKREGGDVECKAKLDYLRNGLIIDYKTTQDASLREFARSIASFGYHRQMAWYMEAAYKIQGGWPRGAILIAQEKEVPEAIAVYRLDESALTKGAVECDNAYKAMCERLVNGKWEAYPEGIQDIGLPNWYN